MQFLGPLPNVHTLSLSSEFLHTITTITHHTHTHHTHTHHTHTHTHTHTLRIDLLETPSLWFEAVSISKNCLVPISRIRHVSNRTILWYHIASDFTRLHVVGYKSKNHNNYTCSCTVSLTGHSNLRYRTVFTMIKQVDKINIHTPVYTLVFLRKMVAITSPPPE